MSGWVDDSTYWYTPHYMSLKILPNTNTKTGKCQHKCNAFHPAGSWSWSCDAPEGGGEILYLLASRCHHPHRLTAWLARHHQSLNYLTDVSLAPAADPVAERQWGAEEHGAKERRGEEKEASAHYILMRCQSRNSEYRHRATHYIAVI